MSKYMGALNDAIRHNHIQAAVRYVGECWGHKDFDSTLQGIRQYLNENGYNCRGMEFDIFSNQIVDKDGFLIVEIFEDETEETEDFGEE